MAVSDLIFPVVKANLTPGWKETKTVLTLNLLSVVSSIYIEPRHVASGRPKLFHFMLDDT